MNLAKAGFEALVPVPVGFVNWLKEHRPQAVLVPEEAV